MGINLEKGGRINLSKDNPSLKTVRVALGWNPNKTDTGYAFDLDASAFVCKYDSAGDPKLLADAYLIFYNNLTSPCGAVKHSGDEKTGITDSDDEVITIDLENINPDATEISFIVTIHKAEDRKQNFGQVPKSYIRLVDADTGDEIAKYSLEDDFSTETAVQFGSLYKKDGQWLFKAVGQGYRRGLDAFVTAYGAEVA